jgi:hypothetical protein
LEGIAQTHEAVVEIPFYPNREGIGEQCCLPARVFGMAAVAGMPDPSLIRFGTTIRVMSVSSFQPPGSKIERTPSTLLE